MTLGVLAVIHRTGVTVVTRVRHVSAGPAEAMIVGALAAIVAV